VRPGRIPSFFVGLASAVLVLVGVITIANDGRAATLDVAQAVTTQSSTVDGTLEVPVDPGSWAADAVVPAVELYSSPGQTSGRSMSETPEGGALVFLVVGRQPGWVHVQVPARPNEATAWVRSSDVRLRHLTQRIVVNLTAHTVTLFDHGQPVLSSLAVVGKPASPTPTGHFYVTSTIRLSYDTGPYGAGAFGLAAFSNVYETFGGGPGQIGIHGTNEPGLIGQSVSHGCVRVPNAFWTELAGRVAPGTPVVIHT
jgi:lipoprotein-anchoring transpeptidase ErfK/SrfK